MQEHGAGTLSCGNHSESNRCENRSERVYVCVSAAYTFSSHRDINTSTVNNQQSTRQQSTVNSRVPSEATLPQGNAATPFPFFPLPFCSSATTVIPIAMVFSGARTDTYTLIELIGLFGLSG